MPAVAVPWSLVQFICPNANDGLSKEEEGQLRSVAKEMLNQSIAAGLDPLSVDQDDIVIGHQMNLTVDAAKSRIVRKIAKEHKLREGGILSGYLIAAQKKDMHIPFGLKAPEQTRLTPYLEKTGRTPRKEQSLFFDNLMDSLEGHKVGLIEGGTGIGKTAAMIASANEIALKFVTKSHICVPTISLIYQFASEYAILAKVKDMAPLKVVLGMKEFVDTLALRELVERPDYSQHKDGVIDWLDNEGPALGRSKDIGTAYLVSSVLEIAQDLPTSEFALSPSSRDDEPGIEIYQSQFIDVSEAPAILLTTHAMTAIDLLFRQRQQRQIEEFDELKTDFQDALKKADKGSYGELFEEHAYQMAMITREAKLGRLPYYTHLLVDEAHLFEQNLANTLSYQASLAAFLGKAKNILGDSFVKRHGLDDKFNKIKENAHHDTVNINDDTPLQLMLKSLLTGFFDAIASSRAKGEDKNALRNEARYVLSQLRRGKQGVSSFLSFSPIRKFPQLHMGNNSFEKLLKQLWFSLDGAACVSASLYYKKMEGDSAAYYKNRLGIPAEKAKEYTPITPGWIKTAIKGFYTPIAKPLTPASRKDKLSDEEKTARLEQWIDINASWIKGISGSAAGGTLVLLTSNADVKSLYNVLSDKHGIEKSRLVAGLGERSLNEQKTLFMQRSMLGDKPIWLAVGAAWTGLDVNGTQCGIMDPATDNLLTDLVIPKLPFGLNRTITHKHFISRSANGSAIEALEATMLFKQGLGRLIRREGLPHNRRIWLMDNRLQDKAFHGFTFPIRRLLDTYEITKITSLSEANS